MEEKHNLLKIIVDGLDFAVDALAEKDSEEKRRPWDHFVPSPLTFRVPARKC